MSAPKFQTGERVVFAPPAGATWWLDIKPFPDGEIITIQGIGMPDGIREFLKDRGCDVHDVYYWFGGSIYIAEICLKKPPGEHDDASWEQVERLTGWSPAKAPEPESLEARMRRVFETIPQYTVATR